MSLISFGPVKTKPPVAPQPTQPTNFKPVAVDNSQMPVAHLRGHVEGMPVLVHYYAKYADEVTATYGPDSGKSPVLQQYKKINNLEMRLDGDIDQAQNDETKEFIIEGSATIAHGVVPNGGDVFCMDVGNGRKGVFEVRTSKRMSALNETVYYISFVMIFYTSDDRFKDLEKKVTQTYHYVKDYAQFGRDPVVTTQVFKDMQELSRQRRQIADDFIRSFLHKDSMTLVCPTTTGFAYDPYTAKAFRSLVDSRHHPQIERVRFHSINPDGLDDSPTVWDAVLQRRKDLLVGCRDKVGLAVMSYLRTKPKLDSIRYSGVRHIVHPRTEQETLLGMDKYLPEFNASEGSTSVASDALAQRVGEIGTLRKDVTPLKPACDGGYYVLSQSFYEKNEPECSLLELLVWDYLEAETVDIRSLTWLVSNIRAWSSAQRYFYTPLVLALSQAVLMEAS